MKPSRREIVLSRPRNIGKIVKTREMITFFDGVFLSKYKPWPKIAANPKIKVRLIILAPITLPRERVGIFLRPETMPTKISGKLVAIAIIIKETTNSFQWREEAIFVVCLIVKSAALTKIKQPKKIKKR
jgi:hypothetical protein